jgi:UDP:flavonoid glycosyltransferase YjiC (YdhE family)
MPPLVNALHQRLIRAFDACWVPDRAGADNLAGSLAHPPLPNTQYLGAISRFSAVAPLPHQWDILVVLSGPEPQRQYLEAALKEQLSALPYKSLMVRGKPSRQQLEQIGPQLYQQDFMSQAALQTAFAQSQWVVTRSGYSTLLDLAALQVAPPLLIPTPGQTEQEYLAQRLAEQGRCITQEQAQLDIKAGIEALSQLKPPALTPPSTARLEQVLEQWLATF